MSEEEVKPKPDVLVTMKRLKALLSKYSPEERTLILDYLKAQGVVG